jgi:CheY-like chemotaxis protein
VHVVNRDKKASAAALRHARAALSPKTSGGIDRAFSRSVEFESAENPTDIQDLLAIPPARVVVVDDDEDMRRLVTTSLRLAGIEVIEARNGLQVLEYVLPILRDRTRALPDVIISDARMPGVNGISLLESLRGCGCFVPVIFMTAFGGEGFRDDAERLGAAGILEKPLEAGELARVVLKQLGR